MMCRENVQAEAVGFPENKTLRMALFKSPLCLPVSFGSVVKV
jgi:hypothetical protein